MEKKTWGGKRKGSGRKKLNNVVYSIRIDREALTELKKRAKDANISVGLYITRELNL